MPRGDTSDYGFPGFSTTGICQKGCVSCRRASRKTVTTGHTLEISRRKMPKIFSALPPFYSNVCTPNLSVFGLLRSGEFKEGILIHNKGVKLSILRASRSVRMARPGPLAPSKTREFYLT